MAKNRFFRSVLRIIEDNPKLQYDINVNREVQDRSLDRIISNGMKLGSGCINIDGRKVVVYMVITNTFDCHLYLRRLTRSKFSLLETTTNDVWLDVKYDVLLTLTENNQQAVVSVLESIGR